MLIGNKLDLINDEDNKRQVTEEAKILCKKHNILWGGEKSFKDMNKNELEEIMKEIIKEIYNKIGKYRKKELFTAEDFLKSKYRRNQKPYCIIIKFDLK